MTVAGIDINQNAAHVHRQNFQHPYVIRELESVSSAELTRFEADVWWLSPPCQPYSRRGKQRDLDDPRAAALLRLIDAIEASRPTSIGVENVVGFESSLAYRRLRQTLARSGYQTAETTLCPTQLGWPNRRPRFYLLATTSRLSAWRPLPEYAMTVRSLLESALVHRDDQRSSRWLTAEETHRYGQAVDRVDAADPKAVTACFAASYGKTILQAGSYLRVAHRLRRFSPHEVARLLGFPDDFRLAGLTDRALWKLLGNSLSLPAVRYVLAHLPNGPSAKLPWLPALPPTTT